jgi:hypothetical protein
MIKTLVDICRHIFLYFGCLINQEEHKLAKVYSLSKVLPEWYQAEEEMGIEK